MGRTASAVLFPWRCQTCIYRQISPQSIRTYASTIRSDERTSSTQPNPNSPTALLSQQRKPQIQDNIPPTSPRYLPVAPSKQATSEPPPRIRGILPTPRNIFDRKRGCTKRFTDAYFAKLTKTPARPRPTEVDASASPQAARNAWRTRLSDLRRRNLVQGVQELQLKRKAEARVLRRASSLRKARRAELRVEREAREDERLTSATTPASMANPLARHKIPDPDREERVAEMRRRVVEREDAKKADRRDSLHTLYMHARDFITTEAQLDSAIEQAFGTPQQPKTWGTDGVSVWSRGNPENIYDRLMRANQKRDTFKESQGFAELANKRMKKIAEALTGGKI